MPDVFSSANLASNLAQQQMAQQIAARKGAENDRRSEEIYGGTPFALYMANKGVYDPGAYEFLVGQKKLPVGQMAQQAMMDRLAGNRPSVAQEQMRLGMGNQMQQALAQRAQGGVPDYALGQRLGAGMGQAGAQGAMQRGGEQSQAQAEMMNWLAFQQQAAAERERLMSQQTAARNLLAMQNAVGEAQASQHGGLFGGLLQGAGSAAATYLGAGGGRGGNQNNWGSVPNYSGSQNSPYVPYQYNWGQGF